MTREEAVQALVVLDQPLSLLQSAPPEFPWDWEGQPISTLDGQGVAAILRRYITGELSAEQVHGWANLVEARDDIEFDPEASNAIFCLANPLINGPLKTVAPMLLERL